MAAAGELETMVGLMGEEWQARARRKEARILARGRAEGRREGRSEALNFTGACWGGGGAGAAAGERLSALPAGVSQPQHLAEVGEALVECGTGKDLLAAARRIVGAED